MDAKQKQLEEKLAELLKQAAEVSAQIQAEEQGPGVPHYDEIEIPAHETGQRLSRLIQSARASDVATEQGLEVVCPDCGRSCRVETKYREVHSMDGPLGLSEPGEKTRHSDFGGDFGTARVDTRERWDVQRQDEPLGQWQHLQRRASAPRIA